MPKEIADVKSSDNQYLHRDFHGALSTGIEYLDKTYGRQAVIDYLKQFTRTFYKPLIEQIKVRGLDAIRDHYENVYKTEGIIYKLEYSNDQLTIYVEGNTPVQYMRSNGYEVAEAFVETIRTVNETLCEQTRYKAELLRYDQETGAAVIRFSPKPAD